VDVVFFPVLASREKGLEILLDFLHWIFVQWMYPADLPNGPLEYVEYTCIFNEL
jgi:hypothetical protein